MKRLFICHVLTFMPLVSGMFGEQACAVKKCSAKQVLVPKIEYKVWANGCGTNNMGIQIMPMDNEEAMDFTDCCNWHDACYGTCGISKKMCERKFDKCMKEKCLEAKDDDAKKSCESTAQIYVMGTKMMGCPAFVSAQEEACECTSKAKSAEHHRKRLSHFLNFHDPELSSNIQQIESLLEKYKNKESLLFLRLLSKYPKALVISKRKDKQTDPYFENLQREMSRENKKTKPKDPVVSQQEIEEHIEL